MIGFPKRFYLLATLFFMSAALLKAQQIKIDGYVYEANSQLPLKDVKVIVSEKHADTEIKTDQNGYYQTLVNDTDISVRYELEKYVEQRISVQLPVHNEVNRLTPIYLQLVTEADRQQDLSDAFSAFVSEGAPEDDNTEGSTPILLSASRDPYTNKAGFQFSPMRFRIRGYDAPYQEQLLNGFKMNDLNSGYSAWSLWNGLNNVTRTQENKNGFETSPLSFGNVGGVTNVVIRPSMDGKGGRVTYSNSNRTYNHRAMFYYSTGLMDNGWAISLSASTRQGNHGYQLGQFYNAYGYYLGIEKKFAHGHSLIFYALGSPTERGIASAAVQEIYDLVGSNYYNPNVGLQNNRWRNARVRNNHEPLLQLLYEYKHPNITFTTGVGYRFGYNAYSALNWHNAPDPRPDYYRNLPSYYTYMTETPDPYAASLLEELWHSDNRHRYIDWEGMYDINRNNYQKIYDTDGNLIAEGKRAEYVIEDRRTDQRQLNTFSVANYKINDKLKLDLGISYRYNRTHNFNIISDLLGGDFWYDIDKFSERDFPDDPSKAQLDLNNPDRIVKKGDVYGHSYYAVTQNAEVWGNFSWKSRYLDAYMALRGAWTGVFREGKQKRGLFPENSYGASDHLNFIDYGVKLGSTLKLTGHHFLQANATVMTQAPYFRYLFISPRTNNFHIEHPHSEFIAGGDLSYILRTPYLKGRVTLFYTEFVNGTNTRSFYDDAYRAFSNYVLTNIGRRHMGVEVGFEAKLSTSLTATAVFTYANYTYTNNPDYLQTVDNSRKILENDRVYWKGFHVSGTPQTAANLSLNYQTPFNLYLGVDVNFFARNYIDMNPKIRTDRAREELDPLYIKQEKFRSVSTVDANIGYSWRIKSGKYLRLNLSVTNLLNNRNARSGGYEQSRIRQTTDGKMMRPFDSRYYYMIGTNYFFNVVYVF